MSDGNSTTYVCDTHALLWYVLSDRKLSRNAHLVFSENKVGNADLIIPAVVLAELMMIAEKKRTSLITAQLLHLISLWEKASNIYLTSLTPQIVVAAQSLTVIPDIFDRLIVTEAQLLNASVLTKDPIIVGSNLVTTVW